MSLEIVSLSDVGRKRPHNEDSIVTDISNGLVILADGMGGYKAGEVASALAVITIQKDITDGLIDGQSTSDNPENMTKLAADLVRDAIIHANSNIYSMAKSNAELVEKIVGLAGTLDRPVATPDETRRILGLKGMDKVNF